jgi:hypothetical protein
MHVSGITFIRYAQYRNIGKPNNINVFGSNKTKGSKQESHRRPWSPIMPEGGGENLSFDDN